MGYKREILTAMKHIALDDTSVFLGYGLYPNGANGTFEGICHSKFIETPVSENLMSGMAIGLSLKGKTPVVYYERFDFVLNALDAIVNHLDKLSLLSMSKYRPTALIRCFVGGKDIPLYTGPTHTQDFTTEIQSMVSFPVIRLSDVQDPYSEIIRSYEMVKSNASSVMIVEQKEFM
jgi:pyruvate/2-oxoglutarate/acetoin dehydrogenase E1 component